MPSLVADVSFSEGPRGTSNVQGQFISDIGGARRWHSGQTPSGLTKDSRLVNGFIFFGLKGRLGKSMRHPRLWLKMGCDQLVFASNTRAWTGR